MNDLLAEGDVIEGDGFGQLHYQLVQPQRPIFHLLFNLLANPMLNMELERLMEISSGASTSSGKPDRSSCMRRMIQPPSASPNPFSSASEMMSRGQ